MITGQAICTDGVMTTGRKAICTDKAMVTGRKAICTINKAMAKSHRVSKGTKTLRNTSKGGDRYTNRWGDRNHILHPLATAILFLFIKKEPWWVPWLFFDGLYVSSVNSGFSSLPFWP
jgi:hypothetical protein